MTDRWISEAPTRDQSCKKWVLSMFPCESSPILSIFLVLEKCQARCVALFCTDPMGFVAEGILSASQRWQSSIFPRWWCLAPKTQTRGRISCLWKAVLVVSLSLLTLFSDGCDGTWKAWGGKDEKTYYRPSEKDNPAKGEQRGRAATYFVRLRIFNCRILQLRYYFIHIVMYQDAKFD